MGLNTILVVVALALFSAAVATWTAVRALRIARQKNRAVLKKSFSPRSRTNCELR